MTIPIVIPAEAGIHSTKCNNSALDVIVIPLQ